jgi:hypothetical protein
MIKSMKEVLLDMVAQKRPAPEARKGVEDWRQAALKSFADNRMIHKPWTRLQLLSLGHNLITEFNPVCLEYLPVLEALELHGNRMATLDTWFRKVGLSALRLFGPSIGFAHVTPICAHSPPFATPNLRRADDRTFHMEIL